MELIYPFEDKLKEQLFHKISKKLRCTVCQNQNLSESNAPIAINLRKEVYRQIQEGSLEPEILEFIVERYGEMILYNPNFQVSTSILWLGPVLMLLFGFLVLFRNFQFSKSSQ